MKTFLSLLVSALLLLSGCARDLPAEDSPPAQMPPAGQSAVQQPVNAPFALAFYPTHSLHPARTANRANLALIPLLYEPLFQVDEHFQAQKVLCQDYSVSADGLVWTFTLRPDVTFSDGTPLTPKEAASALELARSKDSRYASRLSCVVSIQGKEDSLTITLSQPRGDLPLLLDIPIALGEDDIPPGTGPYVFSGSEKNPVLTARSGWWQNKPLPAQELALHPVETGDDLIFSFSTGSISLVDVDLLGTNALGYSGSYETWDYATTDLVYLGFNTREDLLFHDPALRAALSRAIDRDTVAQTVFAGHAVSSPLPVHPASSRWDRPSARALAYDTDPLAALVEELKESKRSLTLLVSSENAARVSTAEFIAYQLESVGLTVTLRKLPFEDYTAALKAGQFDLYIGEVVLTADFDLSPLLSSAGTLNYGGWVSEETDALLAAMSAAAPGETAPTRALFSHLEQQAPIAPICFKNGSVLTQWGRLSGLSPIRSNVFYQLENWIIE